MPVARGCDLPQELTDEILDVLRDDRSTLASCALVCKAWLVLSHTRLFDSATVRIIDAEKFAAFLEANAALSAVVHTFTLKPSTDAFAVHPRTLIDILDRMPGLRYLTLDAVSVAPFELAESGLRWSRGSLEVLTLNIFRLALPETAATLTFFSNVGIDLVCMEERHVGERPEDDIPAPRDSIEAEGEQVFRQSHGEQWNVSSIRLALAGGCRNSSPFGFLLLSYMIRPQSLSTLFITGDAETEPFKTFNMHAKPFLTKLYFEVTRVFYSNQFYHQAYLSLERPLRELTSVKDLHFFLGRSPYFGSHQAQDHRRAIMYYIIPILYNASPTTDTVTLAFGKDQQYGDLLEACAAMVDWPYLETLLRRFTLRELNIIVETASYTPPYKSTFECIPEMAQKWITERLPTLHRVGRLRFPSDIVDLK
ncbi:hypothetical protein NM688_g3280 [Phlebia brevispora]|uniref:Uncharacterized protein n=1 Tax=Phlebia brevispora TaxID=194682 RepID=A0ACC1T6F6_9APHY|nr:hypothetical protein NM688_g3280 [Phlebia brevispora]